MATVGGVLTCVDFRLSAMPPADMETRERQSGESGKEYAKYFLILYFDCLLQTMLMKTTQQDLKSLNLSLNEAIDVALIIHSGE